MDSNTFKAFNILFSMCVDSVLQEKYHFDNGIIKFNPIKVNEDYAKKWKIERTNDFIVLTKNDEIIRDTLYRVGGIGKPNPTDDYFMLLKYTEAYYSDDIMKMSKSKDNKHLEANWCILDKNGNEKVEFKSFINSPYLVNNSCIYSINSEYYNIETGQLYCKCYSHHAESSEFLFLQNDYDTDKSKRGVMKINKKDGSFELFK